LVTLLYAPGASAQVSPSLGNAGSYAVLAGSQITNTGTTTIQGNAGISPGIGPTPHFTGFGTVVFTAGGSVHDADIPAAQAQAANTAVFGALDQGCNTSYAGAFRELAGSNLIPGVYCANSFHLTNGVLTLTGAASNTWIFKSASDLIITGSASRVISPACTVWWRVVSTATFDAGSAFVGNVLASTSITLAAGATLNGRAFARTAEVTLSGNTIGGACSASAIGVPTLSEWAFIMLAALLAVAGAVALRMRTSA
jgi:ice-binding like protein/exosortase sorting signal-containing protein